MTSATNPTVVVRILDSVLGKAEIVAYDGSHAGIVASIKDKGSIFTSRDLSGYAIGTLLSCEVEITGKGSRKVRSVAPHNVSQDTPTIEDTPVIADVPTPTTVESVSTPTPTVESQPIVAQHLGDLNWRVFGDASFYVAPEIKERWRIAYNLLKMDASKPIKMLITGESGDGKSTLAEYAARFMGLSFVSINCATMTDPKDWFGRDTIIKDGDTPITSHTTSEFVDYLTAGNVVICLDEFNRVPSELHNTLFPLLDDRASTTVDKRLIKVGPNVIFAATINRGYEFSGISEIDQAMLNRFDMIAEVQSLPDTVEVKLLQARTSVSVESAATIVLLANALRTNEIVSCSTRNTLSIARMVSVGMSIFDAFDSNIVRRVLPDAAGMLVRKAILELIKSLIAIEPA